MAYTSGDVIDPAIVKPLTAAEFVANGNVTKMNDVKSYYTPYSGETTMLKQYSKQYSLVLTGDIKADVAVETLESIKSVWLETTGMSLHLCQVSLILSTNYTWTPPSVDTLRRSQNQLNVCIACNSTSFTLMQCNHMLFLVSVDYYYMYMASSLIKL